MADTIEVDLSPKRLEVEPGASPAETTVTIKNTSRVVEQFTTELVGLDPEWFSASVNSVGLFPQDKDNLRVAFHPPKRPGVKAGSYPFRVVVRSRRGGEEEAVEGVLDVKGVAIIRIDLVPRRQTTRRKGKFTLTLTNSGTADTQVTLEAADEEEATRIKVKTKAPGPVTIPAGGRIEIPLEVVPKKRPLLGPERTYEFGVAVRPVNPNEDAKEVKGQYTFRPLFPSWAPFMRLVFLVLGFGVFGAVSLTMTQMGFTREMPRRVGVTFAQAKALACRIPLLEGVCDTNTVAARPQPQRNCQWDPGFKAFAEAERVLVGTCITGVDFDGFGNALQYSENGVLFWSKASNTPYFFIGDRVYAFVDSRTRQLDGPR